MATVAQESGALSLCSLLPDLYVLVGSILVESTVNKHTVVPLKATSGNRAYTALLKPDGDN